MTEAYSVQIAAEHRTCVARRLGFRALRILGDTSRHWLDGSEKADEFRKKSAARVFGAADKILKAGAGKSLKGGEE